MYNILKNVQIVISILKEYNIKHLVLSPGSRNVPFVHSVEEDPFFDCYSVVDERGAGFFALGLAKKLNQPVLISCTSSTASSNYLPAIRQAAEEGVMLIALTADRNPIFRGQMENQMIEQPDMYGLYCRKSVDLPTVNSDADFKYCERLVNEALLELDHHGTGPVQINFPAFRGFTEFPVKELPKCRKIVRYLPEESDSKWENAVKELHKNKRILILFGEGQGYNEEQKKLLKKFFEKFNCAVSVEHMSNINDEEVIRTYPFTEGAGSGVIEEVLPDILITMQGNYTSSIKEKFRDHNHFIHWRVDQSGEIIDTFNCLRAVFECTDQEFFQRILALTGNEICGEKEYYNLWKSKVESIIFPDLGFTNFNAIGKICSIIPAGSILHLSILNSIRMANFFDVAENVKVYANVGAYGIDGCFSTFLGQAAERKEKSFLIIGDLSFLYDANALQMNKIDSNVRIAVINNYGGGEFYNSYANTGIEDISRHIAAGHNSEIASLIRNLKFQYLSAHNQKELEEGLKIFASDDAVSPIILEVFTDIVEDANTLRRFYTHNRHLKKRDVYIGRIRMFLGRIKRAIRKRI